MEDGSEGAAHGRDDPHPVGRTAATQPLLVLQVLHEGVGGCVVIRDRHACRLHAANRDRAHRGWRWVGMGQSVNQSVSQWVVGVRMSECVSGCVDRCMSECGSGWMDG